MKQASKQHVRAGGGDSSDAKGVVDEFGDGLVGYEDMAFEQEFGKLDLGEDDDEGEASEDEADRGHGELCAWRVSSRQELVAVPSTDFGHLESTRTYAFFYASSSSTNSKKQKERHARSSLASAVDGKEEETAAAGKAMAGEIIGGLVKSFPDFTFNSGKAPVYKAEDGSYYADIVVSGTHTGEAYAPMPGLTPVEKTDKKVDIGPEKFSLFLSEEGKVVKITIEPKEGKPAGPPGFYTEIGGVLPGPE